VALPARAKIRILAPQSSLMVKAIQSISNRRAAFGMAAAHPLKTIFALALLVRLINITLLKGNDSFFAEADSFFYWQLGAGLANPATFWSTLLSETERMPLFPLLLAGVQSTLGNVPRAVAVIQAVIDAGTCTLIAALGALVSPLVGFVAGVLAALSITLIVFSTQVLTDTLFVFFFTLMLLAGAYFLLRPSSGLAGLAGLAGGLALATRPAIALLLAAAAPLVFAIAVVQKRRIVPALTAAMLFAVAAAAPVAPVLLRNILQYGTINLTTQTGQHLAFWIVPLVTQRADGTPYQTSVDRMQALCQQRLAERGLSAETNPFRLAAIRTEVAREEMARLPLAAYAKAWLEGMAVNLGAPALLGDPRVRALPKPSFYNTPGTSLWERTRAYVFDDPGRYQALLIAGLVGMLPFLALEAIGFVMLARMLPWAAILAGGVLAYFLLLNGPVATAKYRLPIEPVLIVLAAVPLARLVERHCRIPASG
jgi:Dolichyl-phosphate-mannose-protein mannosyltransferase